MLRGGHVGTLHTPISDNDRVRLYGNSSLLHSKNHGAHQILVQGIFISAHPFLLYIKFLVLDLLLGIVQCTSIPHASTVRHLCVVHHVWQHVPQQLAQHVSCREDTTTGAVLSPVDTSARLLNAPVSIQDKIKYEGEWLRLKLGKSLDITPTSLLHQRGVTGGRGAGALLNEWSEWLHWHYFTTCCTHQRQIHICITSRAILYVFVLALTAQY